MSLVLYLTVASITLSKGGEGQKRVIFRDFSEEKKRVMGGGRWCTLYSIYAIDTQGILSQNLVKSNQL